MTDDRTDTPEIGPDDDGEGAPLDGTGGVNLDDERGHWVRTIEDVPPHECMPPSRASEYGYTLARAKPGELWRCNCGRLWECYRAVPNPHARLVEVPRGPEWRPAGLWLMLRHSQLWDGMPVSTGLLASLAVATAAVLLILALAGVLPDLDM